MLPIVQIRIPTGVTHLHDGEHWKLVGRIYLYYFFTFKKDFPGTQNI